MKIIAIIGSPRKRSNTELLVDKVIDGCKSKVDVEVDKFLIVEKKIDYCKGCMTCCYPPPGTGKCVIKDDMAQIIENMRVSDAFIFGTPNHMGTITAPLLNFLSRMMPFFDFKIEYDGEGNIIGGDMSSKILGKKAVVVISQGDPFFSSSLVYMVLEKNLNDFRLRRIGDVISRGNLDEGAVAGKEEDLTKAFDLGVKLTTGS
ncbi:MAG: flavodoxin family protein [Deltaproteobacteria bacterium]|jgi:multimeric flavodoxin WrbA|nr:flavodoxin family protein [Deltaproteobacteria bacterium]